MHAQQWTEKNVTKLFTLPFTELLYKAHEVHRQNFDPNAVQISTLLSIKTGGCPENCAYCPQSAHYPVGNKKRETLLPLATVLRAAEKAKGHGASRFCMAAAWRSPPKKDLPAVIEMIKAVKKLDLETCLSAGMLSQEQVEELESAGLDYYNHNLDTSYEYYSKIVSTRQYHDRLNTLEKIRGSKIKMCCGGIIGMGESLNDRVQFLLTLANMEPQPESVPINMLIKIPGNPLEKSSEVSSIEFVRVIGAARIMMPKSMIRLSAGRNSFSEEQHALCFYAGANSIHYGEKLLTTPLPGYALEERLIHQLGLDTNKGTSSRGQAAG